MAEENTQEQNNTNSKNWFAKHKFLTAVLVIVVLFIFAGALSEEDGGSNGDNGNGSEPNQEEVATAGMGESARDGQFEFTVNGIECGVDSVGDDMFGSEAQGQFCLLEVRVENIGDSSQSLFADNQYLYDDQDREFSADSTATLDHNPSGSTFFDEINPGNSITGEIVFDVPVDAEIVKAELHDSALSGGVEVDLQ